MIWQFELGRKMKNGFKYVLIASAILTCFGNANAAIINITSETFSGLNTAPIEGAAAPTATSGTVYLGVTGSSSDHLSPFGNSTTSYNSIENGTATYAVNGYGYSLLWGSPDSHNTLTFYNTIGDIIATFTGASLACYTTTCNSTGYDIVSFLSSIEIGNVVLSDSFQAFEFGTIAATPLPGALPLFASAVAALGLFMRRRPRSIG